MVRFILALVVIAALSFILCIILSCVTGILGKVTLPYIFGLMSIFVLFYVSNAQVLKK